jgi:CheY-like chemotaxis protein
LESSPNFGTSVKVFWPKYTMPLSGDKQTFENTQTVPANLEGYSVLLVDDNEDVLDVLTIFFEKAGAEVAAVSDPAIALEAIQESPELWNILLTDFDMPGMTGAELARRAKAVRPEIPVILVTGFPDWRSRTTIGTEKVFKRVVSKPLAPESLVALVADTLKESAG